MGKRYYCDYCDRAFKDDPESRKKHILSLQHINNRAEHYRQYRDPEEILAEEMRKTQCIKIATQGNCPFGNNCRFSHISPATIWELQQLVYWRQQMKNDMLMTRKQNLIDKSHENKNVMKMSYPMWTLPPELQQYHNLPPSLWPITPDSITDSNFPRWGLQK